MHHVMKLLKATGWQIQEATVINEIPTSITERYKYLPKEYLQIIHGIKSCIAPDQKSWMLCGSDYWENTDLAFCWNEFEIQSLKAAESDKKWMAEIVNFWDKNFPIYISVRDGYEYAAISIEDSTFGKIVTGFEPEYEEIRIIANNIEEFFTNIAFTTNVSSE